MLKLIYKLENLASVKKSSASKTMNMDSSKRILKKESLKENRDSNIQIDPFHDFMMNYNKKFLEENSFFNPKEENLQTINDLQNKNPLSRMVEQYEIVESDTEIEKQNCNIFVFCNFFNFPKVSLKMDKKKIFPFENK
jgi:hypothetical protein